jgi:hypothetical protein
MGRLFLYPRARARGLSVVREAGAAQTDWESLISAEGWAYGRAPMKPFSLRLGMAVDIEPIARLVGSMGPDSLASPELAVDQRIEDSVGCLKRGATSTSSPRRMAKS